MYRFILCNPNEFNKDRSLKAYTMQEAGYLIDRDEVKRIADDRIKIDIPYSYNLYYNQYISDILRSMNKDDSILFSEFCNNKTCKELIPILERMMLMFPDEESTPSDITNPTKGNCRSILSIFIMLSRLIPTAVWVLERK